MNERIEYLFNLLDDKFFQTQINLCKDATAIYEITKERQLAISLKLIIENKKLPRQFTFQDDLPDATDQGYIPIEVELTAEQLDKINDPYNIKFVK